MSSYAFVTIRESIEFPGGKASTNTFQTERGFVIEKDGLGWVHVKWPATGEHVEFSPSQVKQLRRVPMSPKDATKAKPKEATSS